ncbi:autotransporter outer membrane beta-barrel domain-containing protein [Luteibacter sp. UNCMF366Tsu5.1]|uniref:autotransporter outer membrane beta-barrel domain-containing protein n=1 Tax=Luteibacter sp. UNCMF366Tsu5.1 TaxID=1502758 RepID=UPI000908F2D1|nr:autotransporter outer membrane beta-barrel domain-containing protein [Luteibacter sp. UNCMF366Tsu5.1]SFW75184.1 outer membrane autotransporter barrel domain-containing protein [Luteibacter sp. UNCMF366Tsu5.1]
MDMKSYGRRALAVALAGALAAPALAAPRAQELLVENGMALLLDSGDVVRTSGPRTTAVTVGERATLDAEGVRIANEGAGVRGHRNYGVLASHGADVSLLDSDVDLPGTWGVGLQAQRNAMLNLRRTRVNLSADNGLGVATTSGSFALLDDVRIHSASGGTGLLVSDEASRLIAQRSRVTMQGAEAMALSIFGGEAQVRETLLDARDGRAIDTRAGTGGTAHVVLDRSTVRGRVQSGDTGLSLDARRGTLEGDIVRSGPAPLDVALAEGTWRGAASRVSSLSVVDGTWTLTRDSDVEAVRLEQAGHIAFDRSGTEFHTLRVGSWRASPDAVGVTLGVRLDAGGPLQRQATDRLLVHGDASGQTLLHVTNVGGTGASTAGWNGRNGPKDGISLAQVSGSARADTFRLAGGYVAVGPWQYRLQAYEPGRSDAAQRVVEGEGQGYWDYRLQSAHVEARSRSGGSRAALAPQVPTYLVLPHALFGYGQASLDAVQAERTNESRDPAWHVRAFGGDVAYRSNLPFASYGFDYERRDSGLQVGGDLLVLGSADATLRMGLTASLGNTHVSPRAQDGTSTAHANARGLAWHSVLATESGWSFASSYALTHYRIDVRTPSRGEVLPRLRANASDASLAMAYGWQPTKRLRVEPGAALLWQRLRFTRAMDHDGIDVMAGSPERLTARFGARVSLAFEPKGNTLHAWSPYADLRYATTHDARRTLRLSDEPLATGRSGRSIDLAVGAHFELGARVTATVDTTARMRRTRGGESGSTARLGLTVAL